MSKLNVRVATLKAGTQEEYEATVSIAGLRPTKLVRKTDGTTRFNSRSALTSAVNSVVKNLGYSQADYGVTPTVTKKAAKKSPKKVANKVATKGKKKS